MSEMQVYHAYFGSSLFLKIKKKYIVKTKNVSPGSLLSGQMDRDLKVGDKKIIKDNATKYLAFILPNLKFKHM